MKQLDRDKLLKKNLKAISGMDIETLRSKFAELHGFETSSYNMENLQHRIAYKLQEMYYGGLSPETCKFLDELADRDLAANLKSVPSRMYSQRPGTRFVRRWHGREYEVVVQGKGAFEYNGRIYKSLTAIATEITGTHQSGKAFFGVK